MVTIIIVPVIISSWTTGLAHTYRVYDNWRTACSEIANWIDATSTMVGDLDLLLRMRWMGTAKHRTCLHRPYPHVCFVHTAIDKLLHVETENEPHLICTNALAARATQLVSDEARNFEHPWALSIFRPDGAHIDNLLALHLRNDRPEVVSATMKNVGILICFFLDEFLMCLPPLPVTRGFGEPSISTPHLMRWSGWLMCIWLLIIIIYNRWNYFKLLYIKSLS